MAEITYGEEAIIGALGKLDERIGQRFENLQKVENFPVYLARNDDQMENELRQKGKLGVAPKKGLNENYHEAFKMLYKLTEDGKLVEGIVGGDHHPPTLMELYMDIDARGVAWNYGFGYINAFWGGWNEGKDDAIKDAKVKIEKIKAMYPTDNAEARVVDYYNNVKIPFDKLKKNLKWNKKTQSWEYKFKKESKPTSIFGYDKNGNLVMAHGDFIGQLPKGGAITYVPATGIPITGGQGIEGGLSEYFKQKNDDFIDYLKGDVNYSRKEIEKMRREINMNYASSIITETELRKQGAIKDGQIRIAELGNEKNPETVRRINTEALYNAQVEQTIGTGKIFGVSLETYTAPSEKKTTKKRSTSGYVSRDLVEREIDKILSDAKKDPAV